MRLYTAQVAIEGCYVIIAKVIKENFDGFTDPIESLGLLEG